MNLEKHSKIMTNLGPVMTQDQLRLWRNVPVDRSSVDVLDIPQELWSEELTKREKRDAKKDEKKATKKAEKQAKKKAQKAK